MSLGPLSYLGNFRSFVVSMLVPLANGKVNKLPVNWRTGQVCDAQDPANWCSYDEAAAVVARCGPTFRVAFVLSDADDLACLDIDNCAQADDTWSELACSLVQRLPGAVVEVSQSGRGLHLWLRRSQMPPHASKDVARGLELYSRLRFLVLGHSAIGEMVDDCTAIDAVVAEFFPPRAAAAPVNVGQDEPVPEWRGPVDDADLLRRAMMSKSAGSVFGTKASFADLYHADERVLSKAYPADASSSEPYDRSSADAALCAHLCFWTGKHASRIERLMRGSALNRDKYDDRPDYLPRTIATACAAGGQVLQAKPQPPTLARIDSSKHLYSADPLGTARELVRCCFTREDRETLRYWGGVFHQWNGAAWAPMTGDDVRHRVYAFVEAIAARDFQPNQSNVSNILDALRSCVHLESTTAPPCWIDGNAGPAPVELVACANGLLHLPTGQVLAPTPAYFCLNALPFDYLADAPQPARWLQFLAQVWPDDAEAVDTLQEMFGHLLTPDTTQHKIGLIQGPKRSGKGTIARVLTAVLGAANVANPTLNTLGGDFGLQGCIGKLAAIISDARLSGRTDQKAVAENLLRISGEDAVEVNRKNLPALTMRLGVRFVLFTNELPRIEDSSGAMASRFVIITMRQSFYGREDPGLTSKLLSELPGILAWAVDGWRRLQARGHFVAPKSSAETMADLEDLGSPIAACIRDTCDMDPRAEVECASLYQAYRAWCAAQGIDRPSVANVFGRDLTAALPMVERAQPRREGGGRARVYRGLRLKLGTPWHSQAAAAAVSVAR